MMTERPALATERARSPDSAISPPQSRSPGGDRARAPRRGRVARGRPGRWLLLLATAGPLCLSPARAQALLFPGSIILGRPTDHSVTLNAVTEAPVEVYVEYGPAEGGFTWRTEAAAADSRTPYEVRLEGLEANRRFHYRMRHRAPGGDAFAVGETAVFHTQRPPGEAFTFVIQADSHLDDQSDPLLYQQTLRNMAADGADFMIDLGDTFFSDKTATTEAEVIGRHLLQRPLLGLTARTAPLFLVLGNHEGEAGSNLNGSDQNMAIWATRARQTYYPNPVPDDFYSGDTQPQPIVGLREATYAWEWGDALFVVIDPYWYTRVKPQRSGSGWDWTLGESQYRWLVTTLEGSRARFKFVFSHNMVGGVSLEGRGGIEGAPFYEWGGRNTDLSWGFDRYRPGWGRPIHQVFVDTGVSAWFHGHDHLYVKQDLDGIVYQEVPQPSHPRGSTGTASNPAYDYRSGVILGSSGHLRVEVAPEAATVSYVRAFRSDDPRNGMRNGVIDHRYEILSHDAAPTPTADLGALPSPLPSAAARLTPSPEPASAQLYLPCISSKAWLR